MGFGDKLKGLRDQAQQVVSENKDKIQDAVQVVGAAANEKTHGKYATKIAKVGEKVETRVEKIAARPDEGSDHEASDQQPDPDVSIENGAPQEDASSAPIAHEPENPVTPSVAKEAAAGFPPEFE